MNYSDRIKKQSFVVGLANTLIITGFFIVGMSVAFLLVPIPLLFMFDIPFDAKSLVEFLDIGTLVQNPYGRMVLLYIQGFTALGGFVLSSWLYLRFFTNEHFSALNNQRVKGFMPWLLVVWIILGIMPFTSWLIEWNAGMHLPSYMAEFERWALEKEQKLQALTDFLTNFNSPLEFLMGVVVIALIPAIGEELLFRGLIQRNFQGFLNVHTAIWLTAIIFSAIHGQFLGFIPRAVLGALFGYLYLWSGNLWTPILAHFINNTFTLVMIYSYHRNFIQYNIMEAQAMPTLWVFGSVLFTLFGMYYFKQFSTQQ